VIKKLFCRSKQNNFMITSCKNWVIQGNSAKSINNLMSSFGLSAENMELSPIYQGVIDFKKLTVFAKTKQKFHFFSVDSQHSHFRVNQKQTKWSNFW
jgi:hypothetical protein